MSIGLGRFWLPTSILFVLLSAHPTWAQVDVRAPSPQQSQSEPPKDPLGRDTPRGTVLGFVNAARKGNDQVVPLYLNTTLRNQAAVDLAHKLYVVLDNRLPARLNELSDKPEGSLPNPLKPDQDVVGTIATADGQLDIIVERVSRDKSGPIWLFSRKTLESIPDVFDELDLVTLDRYLPAILVTTRIAGIRLLAWLALVLIIPLSYILGGFVSRLLRPVVTLWHRRFGAPDRPAPEGLPGYARVLLLAVAIRWLLRSLELPLLERQFWAGISVFLIIIALVWILLRVNAAGEGYLRRRFLDSTHSEMTSLLRLARRIVDVLVISAGLLVALRYLGVDATAALAGLGIGGIAVALAAQKTLENVIGGLSLIFDKALRVGDFLKLGETLGTVDYIGLRSTRIRTLDRTIVSVPNGQIANVGIETLSARDKFWFHHFVGLRYETTPAQMRSVIEGIRKLLVAHSGVDGTSIRVRFFRLGSFSLDIEVFAYIFASDWERFLEIQQELLLRVMEIVETAGTTIAFPSQTLHLADAHGTATLARQDPAAVATPVATRRDSVASG
jgi:MscS family membrane protein